MILVEMPFVFFCTMFGVGVYMALVNLFIHKEFDAFPIFMAIGGIVVGVIYLHIIKYTFIEGIFFNCPNIQFFCN